MNEIEIKSFTDIFKCKSKNSISPELYYQNGEGKFILHPWPCVCENVKTISDLLHKTIGPQNVTIGIFHEQALLWDICNFAIKNANKTLIGLNHLDNINTIERLIDQINLKVIITSNKLKSKLENVKYGILFIVDFSENTLNIQVETRDDNNHIFNDPFIKDANEIVSTSGSTGEPSLYYYSNEQILFTCFKISEFYQSEFKIINSTISWLPLSNPFQRMLNLVSLINNKKIYYINDPKRIMEMCKLIEAEIFVGVPRVYQKIFENVQAKIINVPFFKKYFQFILKTIMAENFSPWNKLSILWSHKLIKAFIVKSFGGRVKILMSGSAPIPYWLELFYEHIELPIVQAYGLSESILPVSLSSIAARKVGTVGKVFPPNIIKIENNNILLKVNPIGMALNLQQRVKNKYFDTGDEGFIDDEGYLIHLGRNLDYFKSSTGRRIYPKKIEDQINKLPYLNYVCVIGQGLKFPVAILDVQSEFFIFYRDISKFRKEIADLFTNLSGHEKPAIYYLLENRFNPSSGELTINFKLKRKFIQEKYLPLILQKSSTSNSLADDIQVIYE